MIDVYIVTSHCILPRDQQSDIFKSDMLSHESLNFWWSQGEI